MAFAVTKAQVGAIQIEAGRRGTLFGRLLAAWRHRAQAADAAAELHAMSDRMLADLGVDRWDIDRIVKEGRRR